ncbi:MAG: RNA polymerase sigma factor [Planctomycetota bacterium]|jgi:RNA polymerase sigma-70 factor (ECF subfamily)
MVEHSDKDTELMLRFQAGDEKSFKQLVERNKQRVLDLVFRFLGGTPDAEDIAQEVFISIYKAKKNYLPKAKFTTWLFAICRTTCYKNIRKYNVSTVSLSQNKDAEGGLANRIADGAATSPLDHALKDEEARTVKEAIDSLPTSQRMALLLRKYEQMSYREIAETMDTSTTAVRSILYRAKLGMKERLEKYLKK